MYRRKSSELSKGRRKSAQYMDAPYYENSEKGYPNNTEGDVKFGMSVKALKDLPKSSYSFLADPYAASLPTSNPYAIIAPFNKTVGGSYSGDRNIDGGNVAQYPNSYRSTMLDVADFARLKISLNYRYLPSRLSAVPSTVGPDNPYVGSALVDQQRQAVAEATSILASTTFTQMAISTYVVETDLPMGDAVRTEETISGVKHYLYENLPDVIYAASRYYQISLQDLLGVVNWYNSFRLKQGTMIRSSWNRETPKLNSLFGIFNKKTFLNLIDSICLSFQGEYIDTEWIKQVNMLSLMPSRRSNAMLDPVLELQVRHVRPSLFKLYIKTVSGGVTTLTPVYTDDSSDNTTMSWYELPDHTKKHIGSLVDELLDVFSAQDTMDWARDTSGLAETESARFNYAKYRLDGVNTFITKFKIAFNDVREVFDTISRAGLNNWVKKYRPSITKDTDAPLFNNLIVNDIFKTVMSGANEIDFDAVTKRWRFHTLWNLYSGIPEYDAMSGGAFLTFSAKTINNNSDPDSTYVFIPVAFYYDSNSVSFTTRKGTTYNVSSSAVTASTVKAFNRLVPLPSQSAIQYRVPSCSGLSLTDSEESHAIHTLCQVFGMCKSSGNHYHLDPDIVAAYQIEVEDITNKAINYARSNAPFRGSVFEKDDIGFAKFGQV